MQHQTKQLKRLTDSDSMSKKYERIKRSEREKKIETETKERGRKIVHGISLYMQRN